MHAYNGNPVPIQLDGNLCLPKIQLQLYDFLSPPDSPHVGAGSVPNPPKRLSLSQLLPIQENVYTRDFLLGCRPLTLGKEVSFGFLTQTTTQFTGSASQTQRRSRTGRRIQFYDSSGQHVLYKRPKCRRTVKGSIKEFNYNSYRRTPPPVGAPGPHDRDYEDCTPLKEIKGFSRGTIRRRLRRRAFRKWCRELKQVSVKGLGPPHGISLKPKKASQTRALWFRKSLLWQEHHRRRQKGRPKDLPTTTPLSYDDKIRFGSLNVQGFADTLKLKNCIQLMQEHRLDVLFLSETKSTSYYSYVSEQYMVILSGNHFDKNAGVGAVVSPRLRPHLLDVVQVSPRLIQVTFKKHGGNFHLLGAYAPHSGHDLDTVREPFWEDLENHLSTIPQPEPVYLTGDFNVRFQARHKNDEGVLGPFVFGKGPKHIDHNASSNRSLCIKTMKLQGMVEVASYKTPNPLQQITYRDKAAPPKDWEQFLLDPLPLQQVYDKLHYELPSCSVEVAANIRSCLDLPDLLPPPKLAPQADPIRFQRLDHCFTRHQWLNSVCSCRSKLHTGFPSDHYLLATDFRVKLASKPTPPPRPPRWDFANVTEGHKKQFNDILKELLLEGPQTTTPATQHQKTGVFYTDGSGSSGRCTAKTAAGWGWTFQTDGSWRDACGPVITDPDHNAYRGAQVGSNNTGEVTAIIEALLFAHAEAFTHVTIHSDSRWAINAITGRWRTKHHKALVAYAKSLLKANNIRVTLQWIKAHAGHAGNERADQLANKGRIGSQRIGTTAPPIEDVAPATHPANNTAQWVDSLQEAAKQKFSYRTSTRARPWITEATLEALHVARVAEANNDQDAKKLRNQAKRSAKKDRVKWVHEQLLADPAGDHLHFWRVARKQKVGFRPKRNHLIVENKPVPWSRSHIAFRNHLQDKQWQSQANSDHNAELSSRHPLRPPLQDTQPFSIEELEVSLAKLRSRKAPGPDATPNELFLLLDDDSKSILLSYYNDIWETGEAPPPWKEALVVSIFKGKGSDTDPVNYRPISLLNTIYKVFASLLQVRLSTQHEEHLRISQYGFRAHKGTQHPLFILRRAMEWADVTSTPLHLLFLDWKQAFDSIDHNAMLIALKRFGISNRALNIISSLYTGATFFTKGQLGESCKGQVRAFAKGVL